MNINDLYASGFSRARTRFIMNPLRRVLFKFLRPYFNELIKSINQAASCDAMIANRLETFGREIESIGHLGKAIEARVNTIEARVESSGKDVEAMTHRFNTIEGRIFVDKPVSRDLTLANTEYGILLVKPGDLISDSIISGCYWDRHILELAICVSRKRRGIAVDVGGHVGSMAIAFSGYFDSVICFEPNDFNHRMLMASVFINGIENIVVHNNGLYSRQTALSLAAKDRQEVAVPMNSRGEFDGSASSNLGAYCFSEDGTDLYMHMARTLDSYCLEKVVFVKIDVQGADGEVLMGAFETIAKNLPVVVFEWEENLSKNYSVSIEYLKDRFIGLGYEVAPLLIHNEKQVDYVCYPRWFRG